MDDITATWHGLAIDKLEKKVKALEESNEQLTRAIVAANDLNTKTLAVVNAIVEVLTEDKGVPNG